MNIEVDEILGEIATILDQDIDEQKFNFYVSPLNDLSDAVLEQIGPAADEKPAYKFLRDDHRDGFILSRLGHIAANPSKPEKKEMLSNVYVYHSTKTASDIDHDGVCPNSNPFFAKKFLDKLVSSSKKEWDIYKRTCDAPRDIFILSDDRGNGKTFFINHLFTKYNDYLDEKNVIWIRIDLPEEFGGVDPDLSHWLMSKAVFIVLRYYYPKEKRFKDLFSALDAYISQIEHNEERLLYLENLRNIKEMWLEKKMEEALKPDTVRAPLARYIIDYVINKGFSFIYVLDGFDKVDITPRYEKRFKNLYEKLLNLMDLQTRLGGCYLIVMRTETAESLMESNNQFSNTKYKNFVHEHLRHVGISSIIQKRIEYLIQKLPSYADQKGWLQMDWETHLRGFERYFSDVSETPEFEQSLKLMEEIHGKNNRAKVQVLQLLYYDYLTKEKYSQQYKLIEFLCKAGFLFPPRMYRYEKLEHEMTVVAHLRLFDNLFFPTIFHFPYPPNYNWDKLPFSGSYLLANLRIIQITRACWERNKTQSKKERCFALSASKLFHLCNVLFGYDSKIISKLLEEFTEYNVIRLIGNALITPNRFENYLIEFLPKLNAMYNSNRTGISHDIAYLNMCAMRTLVNKEILNKEISGGTIPFFKAISFDGSNITDWTRAKILNVVSLYRLIKKANDLERRDVEKKKKSLYKTEEDILSFDPLFNYPNELKNSILKQIGNVIRDMPEERKKSISSALNVYRDSWCK
jgi:hypothetical protein